MATDFKYTRIVDGVPVVTVAEAEAHIAAAKAQALEAAAKECEARYMGDNNREDMEAKRCASAIRKLVGKV